LLIAPPVAKWRGLAGPSSAGESLDVRAASLLASAADASWKGDGYEHAVRGIAAFRRGERSPDVRQLNVSTLVTLDGVLQDPGGAEQTEDGGWSLPFFDDEAEHYAYAQLLASDLFLCGRKTYEMFARSWSRMKKGDYADRMNEIPKLVASTTLDEPLEWNASLLKGDVPEAVSELKRQPGKDILMYGSAALMRVLMQHQLIDEYRLWVHPLVLGHGKRLFDDGTAKSALELAETKPLGTGVVILTYRPSG
jgi:dihydrofolate reductase